MDFARVRRRIHPKPLYRDRARVVVRETYPLDLRGDAWILEDGDARN